MQYLPAIIFAIILIVIAFFLHTGKGLWLLSGFNTMSAKERNTYDMKKASKFISKMLIGMAFCLLAFDLGWYFNNIITIILPWIVFGGIIIFTLGYINSAKFKNSNLYINTK